MNGKLRLILVVSLGVVLLASGTGATRSSFVDPGSSTGNAFQAWASTPWVQTTQADFEAGVLNQVDTSSSPGNVKLGSIYEEPTTSVGSEESWYYPSWSRRAPVTINNPGSGLTDYQVRVDVTYDADMQSDFDDIRFVDSDDSTELSHWRESYTASASAIFWVKVPSIPSGSKTIYLYYGNATASSASDGNATFDFFDDFDDASLGAAWTFTQVGGAIGSYAESGTVIRLTGTNTGDLWGSSDKFLFLSISGNYDNVVVESYTSAWGGTHGEWSKMGGVQFRQSIDADSKNRIMSPVFSATGATNSYRLATGGITAEQITATCPEYNRISRTGGDSRAWYSTDGITWTELGSQISFTGGLTDPVYLGIHLAGLSSAEHWVEVDWFRVRQYASSEPTATVGSEDGWSRRAPVTINNPGSGLTDFQVRVDVTYDADMQPDFDDIRFVDSDDSTQLSHWREDYTASASATFWVKVPSIPSGGKTIYLYYGNDAASSASDGDATFIFFDDFEEHAIGTDPDGWTDQGTENFYVALHDSEKWFQVNTWNDWRNGSTASSMANIGDAVWSAKVYYHQLGTNAWGGIGVHIGNGNIGRIVVIRDGGWYRANEPDWSSASGWQSNADIHFPIGTKGRIELVTNGTNLNAYWYNPSGYSPEKVTVFTGFTIPSGTGKLDVHIERPGGVPINNRWIDADDIIVRKYPPPSAYTSLGTIASQVLDTGVDGARWDALFWDETLQSDTDITFEVRASDTSFVKGDASPSWTSVGGTFPVTSGRYMQWQATLTTSDPSQTPTLHEVRVYYSDY